MGLAIVSRIIDRHHGRIEVDSALGKGSTFRVYLPAGAA
ncbi:MAG: ATP-binding protein [Nocardioides sp.]